MIRQLKRPIIKKKAVLKKKITYWRPLTLSRHPTHSPLRIQLARHRFPSCVRLGSTTQVNNTKYVVQINSIQGVMNSASKLRMKQCFNTGSVRHADWIGSTNNRTNILNWANTTGYPIVSKSLGGSRGVGNEKHDNQTSLGRFLDTHNGHLYIFEKFIKYTREYRLHISKNGCFYTCRKLLKNDAPEGTWQRHDDVCSWALENNPSFKKPNNWNAIVQDCINAQRALGLDICGFDVMVQGATRDGRERNNPDWIICESCSAPSFGTITTQKYITELNKLIEDRYNGRN